MSKDKNKSGRHEEDDAIDPFTRAGQAKAVAQQKGEDDDDEVERDEYGNEIRDAEFEVDLTKKIVWESVALKEVEVEIAGDEYLLVEATAEDARRWRANNFKSIHQMEKGKGKNRETHFHFDDSITESQILLVSMCMYKKNPNSSRGNRVKKELIRTWPNALVKVLFKRLLDISDLKADVEDEDDNDDSKNSPPKKRLGVKSPNESEAEQSAS